MNMPEGAGRPTFSFELALHRQGYKRIAGVDEAGRGALAGPLALGLVVYNPSIYPSPPECLSAINDSKKLSPRQRNNAESIIMQNAETAVWTMVSHRLVDRLNVNGATRFALEKLVGSLSAPPDIILLDGKFNFKIGIPIIPIKGGDALSLSIASASVMGKVHRDAVMDRFGRLYGDYGFDKNKGYGTRQHLGELQERGISPIHRRSYEPVRSMIAGDVGESGTSR